MKAFQCHTPVQQTVVILGFFVCVYSMWEGFGAGGVTHNLTSICGTSCSVWQPWAGCMWGPHVCSRESGCHPSVCCHCCHWEGHSALSLPGSPSQQQQWDKLSVFKCMAAQLYTKPSGGSFTPPWKPNTSNLTYLARKKKKKKLPEIWKY